MDYTKAQKNLSKLRETLARYEKLYDEDGYRDKEEQRKLKAIQASIDKAEALVQQLTGEGQTVNPKNTNNRHLDKLSEEMGEEVSEERVKEIIQKEKGTLVAGSKLTGATSDIGAPYYPGEGTKIKHDPNPLIVQAANLVYEALWAASRTAKSVLALTVSGSLTMGSGAVTAEHGTFITPSGEVGLVSALGKGMSADGLVDMAQKINDKSKYNVLEQLIIHTMEGVGGSLGFIITVIPGNDKNKLGGQAFTVGGSRQYGIPTVGANIIFASEQAYLKGLKPIGFNVGGSFTFPPAVKFDINIGEAVAKLSNL